MNDDELRAAVMPLVFKAIRHSRCGTKHAPDAPCPAGEVARPTQVPCWDSPTGLHEAYPERWGDDLCVWCLEAFSEVDNKRE